MPVERALISVFDKSELDTFARGLSDLGIELVASGGTAAYIAELGIDVVPVEEITDVPELLGGRVKTLHPRIHAGILARRNHESDLDDLRDQQIRTVDLVCVNLYPFARVAGRKDVREEDAVEMIDIGGPTLLRAAAKNFLHVVPVCRTERYGGLLAQLAEGDVDLGTRRQLAAEAFAHTAAYEASIASWFADVETFPPRLIVSLEKMDGLSYGENPHQRAAYYAEAGVRRHLLSRVEQLGGRELSFNNLNDLDAARAVLREFTVPACAVVKHANPCGCAVAGTIEEAYEKALAADPVSAYGGIVALNRPVSAALAKRLAEQFVEVLIAPEYPEDALGALRHKEAMRILRDRERRGATPGERDYRRVLGGFLVQD
ncbi:MAG: bifunctional phosphoribosylaminoimidazolecarboxamide formyltransferase/IMP cyclohydrolase, partial [Gaiellaceae bacterium]